MGNILPGSPPPPIPRGTRAQCGRIASPLSLCLVAQKGLGRGCHAQHLFRGGRCRTGHRSPGREGAEGPSRAEWCAQPGCSICIWGQQSRGLPVWQGRVLHRRLSTAGVSIRTATAAVSLHQASHSLPLHLIPSLLPVCLSHTIGSRAMWCWAPRARWWQAPWSQEILHSPLAPWPR